jgi:cytochrome b561
MDLAGQIKEVHETAAWVLLALVSLHTLAALKHHFVDKDSVLGRMIPFLKK